MNTVAFDTYKAMSSLEKRGLSKDAAKGITNLLKDVTENNFVTKTDLNDAVLSTNAIIGCAVDPTGLFRHNEVRISSSECLD